MSLMLDVVRTGVQGCCRESRSYRIVHGIVHMLETAEHQAQHGGGNWVEGRKWDGEWNKFVMKRLENAEENLGRRMNVAEILQEVERLMKERGIPFRFVPYRGD
jgi:hypothetical protein